VGVYSIAITMATAAQRLYVSLVCI